jgi:anti-sigma factor RsiW
MDCREFRNQHVAYVDDLLSAFQMDALQQHLTTCAKCSRHDTVVRRSLMLVRNLRPIEPSPEFMARLNARLGQLEPSARVDRMSPRPHLPSVGAVAALAAGVVAVAYMALETTHYYATPGPLELSPIVATRAFEQAPSSIGDAAFVASVPTGMPVWPAVLMMGQAPMRFASMDFGDAARTR